MAGFAGLMNQNFFIADRYAQALITWRKDAFT